MAKKYPKIKLFALTGFDVNHYKQTDEYVRAIDLLYSEAVNDLSRVAERTNISPNKPFSFSDYPTANRQAKDIVEKLTAGIQYIITEGARKQWLYGNEKNDAFLDLILITSKVPRAKLKKFQDRNLDALAAFQSRKIEGLGLADRIWNYTNQLLPTVELSIDLALGEGISAGQLSRDIRQYLADPDKLFRRVRDQFGNLVLSKNAAAFHPGQGKYRSSYKNAIRLARSEINLSYRQADWLRWQSLDFIIGFDVKLSASHPVVDICDTLQGRYPKWFKFIGWHPQCLCFAIPVLLSLDEFNANELGDLRGAINGEEYRKYVSSSSIADVPAGFREWVDVNTEVSKDWKSQPYFIRDNFVGGSLSGGLKGKNG